MEVLNVMDANEKKMQSPGRGECGRLMGSLLVLLHGTAPPRRDFEKLAEDAMIALRCAHENNKATPFYERQHR